MILRFRVMTLDYSIKFTVYRTSSCAFSNNLSTHMRLRSKVYTTEGVFSIVAHQMCNFSTKIIQLRKRYSNRQRLLRKQSTLSLRITSIMKRLTQTQGARVPSAIWLNEVVCSIVLTVEFKNSGLWKKDEAVLALLINCQPVLLHSFRLSRMKVECWMWFAELHASTFLF